MLIISYLLVTSRDKFEANSYILVLGGALGNFFDRIYHGFVVDFFDFDLPDFIIDIKSLNIYLDIDRFAVFNLADSFICIGVFLIFFHSLFTSNSSKIISQVE